VGIDLFHPVVREWFSRAFPEPTRAQQRGWPAIARGESTLILAPTGSGKTLAAFLWCLNRLLFEPTPPPVERCRVLYISPLKALAADVERSLRNPLNAIAGVARARNVPVTIPDVAMRTGDTPARDRARFLREPADILITTPESLYLLLTSTARERLAAVDTVIVDEIHAIAASKRGAHLALSLERLEALRAGWPPPHHGQTLAGSLRSPARAGGRARGDGSRRISARRPLQRIGLSATQRPLEEIARFLGGLEFELLRQRSSVRATRAPRPRSATPLDDVTARVRHEFGDEGIRARFRRITIVDASGHKPLSLCVDVPVEPRDADAAPRSSPAAPTKRGRRVPDAPRSIWSSIHPRLLDLIRSHRSTLLFVNNRRLAERLAGALNELAGETLVRSHHGSLAPDTRAEVEDLLKTGQLKALVATSSLELGIDMGSVDLVVQIEAPPSVASGLQRIGRAGHQVGATSAGIVFPKFRGDLVACAALVRAMHEGAVEVTRYPRNPLDVLAQQIVAMAAMDTWHADSLFAVIRCAAPFADLSWGMFESTLDMLSGRYPSDAFASLRPRLTWDRIRHTITARTGARHVAIANAGTIPDRGLYGVFLAGATRPVRVGELDEEMVFETRRGETFVLGASTWRVEEITHDRVLVSPAPGEPGKMPFWHGDQAGRSVELGLAIGALVRELRELPYPAALDRLGREHDLTADAAEMLMRYLDEQAAAGAVPDDRTFVIERSRDELGDWRVCLLSPLGSRVHAPWAMAVTAHIRQQTGLDVEALWGDDGFVVRIPSTDTAPDPGWLLPDPDNVEALVLQQIGGTALFAARFREAAARALLLPRRRIGARTPLWRQRKRAADLLAAASRFGGTQRQPGETEAAIRGRSPLAGSFPVLLETYRELLHDHFDMRALVGTLRHISNGAVHVATADARQPSPFAASLLFSYVANYIYDGDAPLAERRAQALSVDRAQLRELIGDAELRELLNPDALDSLERQLQHLDERYRVRSADGLHDLLLQVGDLSAAELEVRSALPDTRSVTADLEQARRVLRVVVAGDERLLASEDAARYRDALAVRLPAGLPKAFLAPVRDPAADIVLRYARSHGPFTAADLAMRYGFECSATIALLRRLVEEGHLIEGEFRPRGVDREWVDPGVLNTLRRRSLARLRQEIEPVDADALGRFLVTWHGVGAAKQGADALLGAIDQLQGAPLPASVLEEEILPARVHDYQPAMLDVLMGTGNVVWAGVERLGDRDGRIALYRAEHLDRLRAPASMGGSADSVRESDPSMAGRAASVYAYLQHHGASFFAAIHEGTGSGFPQDTVDALWDLVWQGVVTNDTLHPLRAYLEVDRPQGRHRRGSSQHIRRTAPRTAEGRWSLIDTAVTRPRSATEWSAAAAQQLLRRHGIVTREAVLSEAVPGGFAAIYPVLTAMEHAGRIQRGYFVAGLGAAQFAMRGALELIRSLRDPPDTLTAVTLAATDPANPYGSIVRWPDLAPETGLDSTDDRGVEAGARLDRSGRGPTRIAGAVVILVNGLAAGYLRRNERDLLLFISSDHPLWSRMIVAVARCLVRFASAREEGRRGLLIGAINGRTATQHAAARIFVEAGFARTAMGLQLRTDRIRPAGYPGAFEVGPANASDHQSLADDGGKSMVKERNGEASTSGSDDDEAARRDAEVQAPSSRAPESHDQERERAPSGREAERGAGTSRAVDPDSAASDVNRDDTIENA
jgi:ATP-dependent helicase Lhr and Lhr-like helicase